MRDIKTKRHYAGTKEHYDRWSKIYTKHHYSRAPYEYPACRIRIDLIVKRIKALKAKSIVDCGCGSSYPLIRFLKLGLRARGFDLSPGMVEESQKNLIKGGFDPNLVCEANLEDGIPFKDKFDVMMMHGPLMHSRNEKKLLTNARKMLNKGGILLCEVRNELMSVFSMNEHTRRYFLKLVQAERLPNPIKRDVIKFYSRFAGTGAKGNQPWDAKYFTKYHNPFTINSLFEKCGFKVTHHHFAHFHCLPPIFEKKYPEFFQKQSLKMEKLDDWRGYLMASTFLAEAKAQR